jgi:cyanuric acid amidohydrolase
VRWTSVGPLASRHTTRVAVTAGDTGGRVHALVLGHSRRWRGPLRIASTQLADMLDVEAIARVRRGVPLAAFYKGDPPAGSRVRGARTTMAGDSDIHAFRHFRAAMSGVFGATLGTARVFVGGGAECQCVPGGGVLTLIDDLTRPTSRSPA